MEHDPTLPESSYDRHYNETFHGLFEPRLFLIDCENNLGPINIISEESENVQKADDTTSHRIERYDRTNPSIPLHPIRQAVIQESTPSSRHDILDFSKNIPKPNFWTDFWELKNLPTFKKFIPTTFCESPNQFRYWFQCPEQSVDELDESHLRSLVEATDSSVHTVRILSDTDSGYSQFGISCSDYLRSCYPKSTAWNLSCPPIPSLLHGLSLDENLIAPIINFAKWLHEERNLNDSSRSVAMNLLPSSSMNGFDRIYDSSLSAIWLDSLDASTNRENQILQNVSQSSFSINSAFLGIDGQNMYSAISDVVVVDDHSSCPRSRPYHRNLACQVDVVNSDSSITAGYYHSVGPFLKMVEKGIARFHRDFKPVWETKIETDEWTEISDTIKSVL